MITYPTHNVLDAQRHRAIKVQFTATSGEFFDDAFIEPGMVAWLTKVSSDDNHYILYFDFQQFEQHNQKYFIQVYYPNDRTTTLQSRTGRGMFTALESGDYDHKLMWYFGDINDPQQSELDARSAMEILELDAIP